MHNEEFKPLDFLINWKTSKICDSWKIPMGYDDKGEIFCVEGPNVLFCSDFPERKTEVLTTFLYSAAIQFSPEDMNFYIIDCIKKDLYQNVKDFPHFAEAVTEFGELKKSMYVLEKELKKRQRILGESGKNNIAQYAKAYKAGEVKESLPVLFVVVDELQSLLQEKQFVTDFLRFVRIARSLGIYIIMTAMESECDELINASFHKYNLNKQLLFQQTNLDKKSIVSFMNEIVELEQMVVLPLSENTIWSWTVNANNGEKKTLQLVHGDLIVLYERDEEKVNIIAKKLNESLREHEKVPEVFLSYSSKQFEIVKRIRELLEEHQISCWMAPASIPSGSSYLEMIPLALSQVEVVLLILTPDAEKSRWVQKEVGTAIGADKVLIPYQLKQYSISDRFRFLLDGEQILLENTELSDGKYSNLIKRIQDILKK